MTAAVQLEPAPLGVHAAAPSVPSVPCVGLATMLKVRVALSISVAVRVTALAVSSLVVTGWFAATGASLTATTVNVMKSVPVRPTGSVTVMVMVAVPF